jgi:hypothetical protein
MKPEWPKPITTGGHFLAAISRFYPSRPSCPVPIGDPQPPGPSPLSLGSSLKFLLISLNRSQKLPLRMGQSGNRLQSVTGSGRFPYSTLHEFALMDQLSIRIFSSPNWNNDYSVS